MNMEGLQEFSLRIGTMRSLFQTFSRPIGETPSLRADTTFVVIGAGTAGLVTAAGAAALGARVALVERHMLGGDCLNYGCVPSKALIRASRSAQDVRMAEDFGIRIPKGVTVDFSAVMERMRKLRSEISFHDSANRFRELGVDSFFGRSPVYRERFSRNRREKAFFQQGRDRDRSAGRRTSDRRAKGSGISHQRNGLLAHRAARAVGSHRGRPAWLRACPGFSKAWL